MVNNIEENILNLAINKFNEDKEVRLEIEKVEYGKNVNVPGFDKVIKFRYQKGNLTYCTDIKQNINTTVIALLLHLKGTLPHPLLLVTRYVNNKQAEELKKNAVQFLDIAGNAYLNCYPLYIFIKGNKPPDIIFERKTLNVFEPGGLKIIFALLRDSDLVKKSYRYIAEIANVALGTVGKTINGLINLGFIVEMGDRGRELLKKDELFTRWLVGFNEKLKPKLLINRFAGAQNWWVDYKLNPKYAQWGGEVAAYKLTSHMKPQDIVIYADSEKYQNIVIENKLRKDINGNIEFYERFWKFDINDEFEETVTPILIYADLINNGNQRVLETAKVIYEGYLDIY